MNTRTPLPLIVSLVIFIGIGAEYYFVWVPQTNQNKVASAVADKSFGWKFPAGFRSTKVSSPLAQSATKNLFDVAISPGSPLAYSDIRDPGGIPQGLPVRLKIPVIGVDSAIEDALITPDGRMDVPAGSVNVAWFALGPHPGTVGSAVIGGHYGIQNGVPFVFYNLDKLKIDDKVYIVNDKDDTLAFVVRSTKLFDRNADATTVFTSNDGLAHLNLITCEGVWNQVNGNYPERLVIFTDAIPGEGPAPATLEKIRASTSNAFVAPAVVAATVPLFSRSLSIGASGTDVVALQTFLEQRGLLELPPGVVNGYFGALTRAAIAKYQASVGLPSVGTFGPLTRATLNAELVSKPALPNTGMSSPPQISVSTAGPAAHTPQDSSPQPSLLVQSVKSSFATPLDGFITLVLLVGILIMVFTISRRLL